MVRNLPARQETWVQSLGQEDPLERGMVTHPSVLAAESHGQRSLVGYRPWRCKESNMTERRTTEMNLFTEQKQTHRHRKETYGNQRGKVGGRDK